MPKPEPAAPGPIDFANALDKLIAERDRLASVNAQLLAALKTMTDRYVQLVHSEYSDDAETDDEVRAARAAIRAATGSQK